MPEIILLIASNSVSYARVDKFGLNYQQINSVSEEIIKICQLLHGKNMLAAADGNVSCRINDEQIVITPSGRLKAFLNIEEMAVMDIDGNSIVGRPSSEKEMHLAVYRKCPEARCVVHAHPPTAIALSIAHPEWSELPSGYMSELILAVGSVPIVSYARPGSIAMAENLFPYLPEHRLMILARHGALSWGEDHLEAYAGMERLEHSALILRDALLSSTATPLPREEINILREMRINLGKKTL